MKHKNGKSNFTKIKKKGPFLKDNVKKMKMKTTSWIKIFVKHTEVKLLFLGVLKSIRTLIVDKSPYIYTYM